MLRLGIERIAGADLFGHLDRVPVLDFERELHFVGRHRLPVAQHHGVKVVALDIDGRLCAAGFGADEGHFDRTFAVVHAVGDPHRSVVSGRVGAFIGVERLSEGLRSEHLARFECGMLFGKIHRRVAAQHDPVGDRSRERGLREKVASGGGTDEYGAFERHVRRVVLHIHTGNDTRELDLALHARHDGNHLVLPVCGRRARHGDARIGFGELVGRIAVGREERGTIKVNQEVTICDFHDANVKTKGKVVALYEFDGLSKNPVQEAHAGEIVALSGMADITIGRTLCAPECVEPLPFVKISDPTIEMTFAVNDSPFAGKEGKFVTSRNLRDRLEKELLKDVSLHVTEQGTDSFNVAGRGEMHLSILMETMRREGYEFSVSTPRVLTKVIDGKVCEPIERMVADVPEECMGSVIEKMGKRKGDLLGMTPMGSRYRLEFLVPSRGLFGYRNEFLTDTRGEGVMSSVLDSYAPMKGEIERRQVGSLVAFETGEAVAYGLAAAQERGALFIGPGTSVYAGMVVGVCSRNEDMTVNVCKKKQLTNMRAAGSDEALRLTPPRILSLEQCLEFLADDELLECTPKSLRIRKRELDHAARMRNLMKKRAQDNA